MPIQIYSFFAGVGFLDLGFQNANFDIAFVNEYNERFLYAYQYARKNDSHVPHYGYSHLDIRSFYLTIRGIQHSQIIGRRKTF